MRKIFKASKTFPVEKGEVFKVRDGKGHAVERWACLWFHRGDENTQVCYRIDYI
jgi:hypothetical protein